MLAAGASGLLATRSSDEFRCELIRLAKGIGFETVSAAVVTDHPGGRTTFAGVHNTPDKYLGVFRNSLEGRRDPVMQFCKTQSTPIVWGQSTYVDRGAATKYEIQAACGYRHGIAMAMHLPQGRHFFLGVDRDRPLPANPLELERLTAAFVLLTLYAQVAASVTVVGIEASHRVHSIPTARELEVLRWTLAGKTAWEVGMLLKISERTAAIHANHATHKLGCVGKHQAALKALQLGLISSC